MRLINADAVFPWYMDNFKDMEPSDVRFSMNDIKGNLDNIPTPWIPVSERLPEVKHEFYSVDFDDEGFKLFGSDRVLVSYISNESKNTEMCVSRLSVCKYDDGKEEVSWDSVSFDYEESNVPNVWGEVIAWMPLPSHYK